MPAVLSEHVVYEMEFTYDGVNLATFKSLSPLPIPAVDDRIRLHDVRVQVRNVSVTYGTDDSGQPEVRVVVSVREGGTAKASRNW